MGFLAPAFFIGFLAIALPIWLHRLQAQSSTRQSFSSAMLLESSEEQVHVRKKLKYLALLALRISLLVLLALAFAKPFLARDSQFTAAAGGGSNLIVVDTSASMQREGVFAQALNETRRLIDAADDDALVQVVTADASLQLVTSPSTDRRAIRTAVAGLSAGALRLDYGELMGAIERHAATLPAPLRVHLVSDFQASAMPVRFADLVASGIAEFIPHVVGTGSPVNWSIDFLRATADALEIGVSGFGDRETLADIELSLNGIVVESRGLSADGQQVIRFAMPQLEQGDNRVAATIVSADDLQIDNQWFHVIDNKPPSVVPLITANPAGLPVTYLTAALQAAAGNQYLVQTMLAGQFDRRVLSRHRWLVIDEIGSLDNDLAEAVNAFLQNGGNVLAFAGDRAAAMETIPVSGHRHAAGGVVTANNQFVLIGQVDTAHQALLRGDGWLNVRVSRTMPVMPADDDQVLVRLQNGEPLLLEKEFADGRLLLVLGGLDNRWNDLPVRPVFVSFVNDAARYLSGVNEVPRIYTSGASLPLALAGNLSGQVVDPDGNTVLSLADTTREQQIKLNKPGFYEVYTPQGGSLIAVNIDPLESDLRSISQDVLDRWGDAVGGQPAVGAAAENRKDEAGEGATNRVELWHWLLLAAAFILIAESFLGNTYLTPRRLERG